MERVPAQRRRLQRRHRGAAEPGRIRCRQRQGPAIESWIAVEIARVDQAKARELEAGLKRVLADVRASVEDWPAMRHKALADRRGRWTRWSAPRRFPNLAEAKDLLRWLDDGNFTFLGYREYDLVNENGEDVLLSSVRTAAWA